MQIVICFLLITLSIFFNSNHAAADWNLLDSDVADNLYGVHFLNAETGWAVGWGDSDGAVVLSTTDGGDTWDSDVPVTNTLLFSITFIDSQRGYAAGYDGANSSAMLLETSDGGEEWMMLTFDESFGFYIVQFPTEEIGYVCGYGGVIMKSEDSGWSWTELSTRTNDVFRKMHFIDEDNGWAAGGSSFNNTNRIFKTDDGGDRWEMVKDFGNSFVIGGISFIDEDIGIVAGNDGHEAIFRTTDGGDEWERVYSTDSRSVLQDLYFDGDVGWACGDNGLVHYSLDGGESWQHDESLETNRLLLATTQIGDQTFAVGENGSIFKRSGELIVEHNLIDYSHSGFSLLGNYPNPFNSSTSIGFHLDHPETVNLRVIDANGRLLQSFDVDVERAGIHSIGFNAVGLSSGRYYYQLTSGSDSFTGSMIFIR